MVSWEYDRAHRCSPSCCSYNLEIGSSCLRMHDSHVGQSRKCLLRVLNDSWSQTFFQIKYETTKNNSASEFIDMAVAILFLYQIKWISGGRAGWVPWRRQRCISLGIEWAVESCLDAAEDALAVHIWNERACIHCPDMKWKLAVVGRYSDWRQ